MHRLPPGSIYRLQILAQTGPRFYQLTAYMRRLEVLGLVAATGRADPEKDTAEYQITDAGRVELHERFGSDTPIRG